VAEVLVLIAGGKSVSVGGRGRESEPSGSGGSGVLSAKTLSIHKSSQHGQPSTCIDLHIWLRVYGSSLTVLVLGVC
jgi:hypothetical protein